MTSAFLVALLVLESSALELHRASMHEDAFAAFMQRHGRTYERGSEEYAHRLGYFSQRMARVEQLNARPGRLWTAGAGPLSDASQEELAAAKGWFGSASTTRRHGSPKRLRSGMFLYQDTPPEEFLNWTQLSALQVAPDQGGCGSCWAVASALVLTTHAEIYGANQSSFSEQELVNCVPNPKNCGGSGGCEGATVELAMSYALASGVRTENEVPYHGVDEACPTLSMAQANLIAVEDMQSPGVRTASAASQAPSRFGMVGWERLEENKYEPLLRAVYERGPVAVSVNADNWDFYSGGIFDSCIQNAIIDHAVTLIGYGVDKDLGKKYWTIMNSWGSFFGEDGKMRLLRDESHEDTYCGIDNQPDVGTGCDGGPKEVKVCGMCGILYDNVVPHFQRSQK